MTQQGHTGKAWLAACVRNCWEGGASISYDSASNGTACTLTLIVGCGADARLYHVSHRESYM